MQTASSRIWTRVTVSLSYDGNHDTMNVSMTQLCTYLIHWVHYLSIYLSIYLRFFISIYLFINLSISEKCFLLNDLCLDYCSLLQLKIHLKFPASENTKFVKKGDKQILKLQVSVKNVWMQKKPQLIKVNL